MKIIIFGGSGFIGKHLTSYLIEKGNEVVLVSRSKRQSQDSLVRYVTWNELQKNIESLEEADVFVNLSGETINQYWTPKAKTRILESRINSTKKVAYFVQKLKSKPKVVINSSAVGIYGMLDSDEYDEDSPLSNNDFLARIVYEWERAADTIEQYTRLVKLRLGVVLGIDGGALPKMLLPYKLFVGGRIGSGKQWLSWIHIEDLVRLIEFCVTNEKINGPVNATAPSPVTNDEFGRAISSVMGKPHFFHVPSLILRVMLGEMSQMVLNGQKVIPKRAVGSGFTFTYPTIDLAVYGLLQKKKHII
ncbi:TIGR01777 family protein [Schinkia azotoformans MEV2011]|uniref:TIGR01777 family protein n=1 Tax=Schinkia azotoformans MEV2011 TaxID=1348973 RepID=A0A072NF15_SCHAZ|nr:TIGR01777 family oxidoreductase [Schinkia azotoformans]KEF36101.1 TIGR01777 family protein [Schinkia azotoformans MEV2011]MEC1695509.1 TIGR01777 family oxidoreductase [Schinkia azotoformans]MEC1718696.1 TIGR01777 family oxidoreductase [Schinkia azotoformans]MEC1727158.1 TIGR01777 family oxidoreductase [Schinkia azotoformans]MEC1743769.1 TIGR01777 family oxidoreductase [Schinkia azotoformans]